MKQFLFILILLFSGIFASASSTMNTNEKEDLYILWTSDNEVTAIHFIGMYTGYAKKGDHFNNITVIIWGGANELIRDNEAVQNNIQEMIRKGIHVEACLACANKVGTTKLLKSLEVDVDYLGQKLTNIIKSDQKLLTI